MFSINDFILLINNLFASYSLPHQVNTFARQYNPIFVFNITYHVN